MSRVYVIQKFGYTGEVRSSCQEVGLTLREDLSALEERVSSLLS